ncbi:MAG: hypothetical protein AAFV29_08345, partial [Myxococcota bacterium]
TGKSALLQMWKIQAQAYGSRTTMIDLQSVEAAPDHISERMASDYGVPLDALSDAFLSAPRCIFFFDTWERGETCESWLQDVLIPSLPANVIIAIASRRAPDLRWRTHPGLSELIRVISLDRLSEVESKELLKKRGVEDARASSLTRIAYGHPLALSLMSEVKNVRQTEFSRICDIPTLIADLLGRFVSRVPSDAHRRALHLTARVRNCTESLLRAVVPQQDAGQLFDWLRSLSFMIESPSGLQPHVLAREVIDADFHWRDRPAYEDLHRQLSNYYVTELRKAGALDKRDALFLDYYYLGRIDPSLHDFIAFDELGAGWASRPSAHEHEEVLQITKERAPKLTSVVAYWLSRRPKAFTVVRGDNGEPRTVACTLVIEGINDADRAGDPALIHFERWLSKREKIQNDARIICQRFLLSRTDLPTQKLRHNRILLAAIANPNVVGVFQCVPAMWASYGKRWGSTVVDELTASLDEGHAVIAVDNRLISIDELVRREIEMQLAKGDASVDEGVGSFRSRAEIERAVIEALKVYGRDSLLERCRLKTAEAIGGGTPSEIRAFLAKGLADLRRLPKDRKLARAVEVRYLEGTDTREAAAERLGIPFSTYRRHLSKGTMLLIDWVWEQERRAGPDDTFKRIEDGPSAMKSPSKR